jgi:cysteate synthase
MGKHRIKCLCCGEEFHGYALSCTCHSLLRTEYNKLFQVRDLPGMWKFIDWLPCKKPLHTTSGSITYKSEGLARELGLKNLYITFTGYWPERNAFNMT